MQEKVDFQEGRFIPSPNMASVSSSVTGKVGDRGWRETPSTDHASGAPLRGGYKTGHSSSLSPPLPLP